MAKPKTKHKKAAKDKKAAIPKKAVRTYSVGLIYVKLSVLALVLIALITYMDAKGYFNPDLTNNHTLRKWDAFYDFSKKNNVDILLVGNSHLYTGINPINLSVALGVNSFILASPGTNIADTYFCLKEALTRCKPALVVVETYGIIDFNPYELKNGALSDQFKSFTARRNIPLKVESTPYLFSVNNYPYAWSTTVRNHDYIFNNREQITINKQLSKAKKIRKKDDKLYLGRFVRFTDGLTDSVLNKYEVEGSPVNGAEYSYSKYAEKYVEKIVKLCNRNDIELIFLTLPMFEKHTSNYPKLKKELAKIISKYLIAWLDMQEKNTYSKIGFEPSAFENSYSINQHMTYQGSLLSTYNLASFVRDSLQLVLPDRSKDQKWHNIFYGQEGYFYNFSPKADDSENKMIKKDIEIRNINISEIFLQNTKDENKRLIVKIKRDTLKAFDFYSTQKLNLIIKFRDQNQENLSLLWLMYDNLHTPKDEAVFVQRIKPIEILDVLDATFEDSE